MKARQEARQASHTGRWISWLVALAMITALIVATLHVSEERELLAIAQRAQPWWLAVAIPLILALGELASVTGVLASFRVSNLFRTLSIVPGGRGIFETASVMSLTLVGIAVPLALAATLLFRGLSFWLPMLPGLVFAHRARRAR